jgi:hypothetical protein
MTHEGANDMAKTETYKGFSITKKSIGAFPWVAFDADGEVFDCAKTKSQLRGGIVAFVNGDAWMIEELRRRGYSKA